MLSKASPIQVNKKSGCARGLAICLSKGWKFGIMPTKEGRGIIGVKDFGLWLMGLGKSIRGGGIKCLETKKSKDYSSSLSDCSYFSGDYYFLNTVSRSIRA